MQMNLKTNFKIVKNLREKEKKNSKRDKIAAALNKEILLVQISQEELND